MAGAISAGREGTNRLMVEAHITFTGGGATIIPLFDAHRQLIKVRGVMWFALVCAAASVWAGLHLVQTYGLNPGNGGVLAPLPVRLAWGIGVGMLGLGFAGAMWLYGRCYVARLELDEQAQQLHVYTVRFWGTTRYVYDLTAVKPGRRHRGFLYTIWHTVSAPWQTMWLAGRRLPLILDEQGEVLDRNWIRKLRLGRH